MNANFITTADGYLKTFFEKTKEMTPDERGKYLEEDEVGVFVTYPVRYLLHNLNFVRCILR